MRRLLIIALMVLGCQMAWAEPDWSKLADAIHIAENGHNLDQGEQYGIHSVHYRDEAEAREICIRTCKHAWRDHTGNYLIFLAKRYCPVNWKVWHKNVTYFYSG